MEFVEWADSKTRRLGMWDLGLIKWSCLAGGVLLAQLVPSLGRVDKRVLAAITIALAIKPAVTAFSEKPAAH
jgi:hypothetical protein